jgi:hypothetical protein
VEEGTPGLGVGRTEAWRDKSSSIQVVSIEEYLHELTEVSGRLRVRGGGCQQGCQVMEFGLYLQALGRH